MLEESSILEEAESEEGRLIRYQYNITNINSIDIRYSFFFIETRESSPLSSELQGFVQKPTSTTFQALSKAHSTI